MPWDLKNVALDPAHALKRRSASRMEMEPTIAGTRIRMRQSITISDEQYERNKARIDLCVKHGVLTATKSGAAAAPKTATPPAPAAPTPAAEAPLPEPSEPEPAPEPSWPSEDETPVQKPKSSKGKKSKKGKK